MIKTRSIPMINGSSIIIGISGIAEGDVSTVKLVPSNARYETAANCFEPKSVIGFTVSYMMD